MGLGCMGLSHGYGPASSPDQARAVLMEALERGVNFFDTAALYGNGANETLVGEVLGPLRPQFVLATKCGINHPASGLDRRIDGRPDTIRASCEASLRRLQTDVIDLFYLHRWDKQVPIEDSVGLIHFWVGMAKAPVFAFLIAVIGCLEGFRVQGSAQSVGEHTTSAVVQSIFVVIVVDAIAALFCMEMGW